MKAALLTGAALMIALAAAPARAQIPVTDAAGLSEQIVHYGQMLLQYARQGQQLAQEAQLVETQATMLMNFVHDPSLGQAMGLMGAVGVQNPLPVNPYAVQSLLNGSGGIAGNLGALGSLANGSYSSNHYYSSPDSRWITQETDAREYSNAGGQGIGMQMLRQIADHIPVMQALRDKLSTASSPKDVQDAQAALATEQLWATNTGAQLQAANLMYMAQRNASDDRENERLNESIDAALNQARARGDWP